MSMPIPRDPGGRASLPELQRVIPAARPFLAAAEKLLLAPPDGLGSPIPTQRPGLASRGRMGLLKRPTAPWRERRWWRTVRNKAPRTCVMVARR